MSTSETTPSQQVGVTAQLAQTGTPSQAEQAAQASQTATVPQKVAELGPWFHNITLPDGTQTAPNHFLGSEFPGWKWRKIAAHLPEDLTGMTALDIGCNAGYYTLEPARRGAKVTGIDVNEFYLRQARWACEQFGLQDRVTFRQQGVYELAHTPETYDIVWFMGVFYHLRYGTLALDIATQKATRYFLFQTLTMPGNEVHAPVPDMHIDHREAMLDPGWPKMAFIEHKLAGDPTNFWAINHAGALALLRSCGMRHIAQPDHEIYLCEPDPDHPSCATTFNRIEYQHAIGQQYTE